MIRVGTSGSAFASNIPQQIYTTRTAQVLELGSSQDRVSIVMEPLRSNAEQSVPASRMTITSAEEFSVTTPNRTLFQVSPQVFRCDSFVFYQAQNVFIGYGSNINAAGNTYPATRLNVNGGLEVKGDLYTTGTTQFKGIAAQEFLCRPETSSNTLVFRVVNSNSRELFVISPTGLVSIGRSNPDTQSLLHVGGVGRFDSNVRSPRLEHPSAELLNIQMDPVANTSTGICSINAVTTRVTGRLEVLSDLKVSGNLDFSTPQGLTVNSVTTNSRLTIQNSNGQVTGSLIAVTTRSSNPILNVDTNNQTLVHWNGTGLLGWGTGSNPQALLHMSATASTAAPAVLRADFQGSAVALRDPGHMGFGTLAPIAAIHVHSASNVLETGLALPSYASNAAVVVSQGAGATSAPFLVLTSNTTPRAFFDARGALILGGLTSNDGYNLRSDSGYIENIAVRSFDAIGGAIDMKGRTFANLGNTIFAGISYLTADQSVSFRGLGSNMTVDGSIIIRPPQASAVECVALGVESSSRPVSIKVASGSAASIELMRGTGTPRFITQYATNNTLTARFETDTTPRLSLGTPTEAQGSLFQTLFVASNQKVGINTSNPATSLDIPGALRAGRFYSIADSNLAGVSGATPLSSATALDQIANLQGFAYTQDAISRTGLFANQIQSVLPNAVFTDTQGQVSYDSQYIIALLVEAVKQLQTEVNLLKNP